MDLIDVLITLLIGVILIVREVIKIKKKTASTPQKIIQDIGEKEGYEERPENGFFYTSTTTENEKIEDNSSKSPSYFTYEDISKSEEEPPVIKKDEPFVAKETYLQEVENEIETTEIDLQDPEELKKAILYGEILKNPYN